MEQGCRYKIFKATEDHLATMMEMYDHSRSVMRANGNTTQWVGYPTEAGTRDDIAQGRAHIIADAEGPKGTFAMQTETEHTYAVIEHGRWIDEAPYYTLHRLACRPETHGIAAAAINYCLQQSPNGHLRADTHEDNHIVRHILESHNFVRCGTVHMDDGTPRIAYEAWRYPEVDEGLKSAVAERVLPQYDGFDAAHRRDHALRVVARAMTMARKYGLQPDLTYAAAALHDIGLCEGRETHHLASGRMIRHDEEWLADYFTPAEIEQIAQAAEDHRASAKEAPRSLLGCVVAEADRDVEPETIVRRTVEYGLSHYPTLDLEGHWQRTLQHLDEKYSGHGYIKLWLPDSVNAAPLAELRDLIADETRLRRLFLELMETMNYKQ